MAQPQDDLPCEGAVIFGSCQVKSFYQLAYSASSLSTVNTYASLSVSPNESQDVFGVAHPFGSALSWQ